MTGHYSRSCHVTTCNTCKMWGLIYLHAMRTMVMPCVTACAVTSCTHGMAHTHRQAGCPYVNVAHQKLLMGKPFMPAELYLTKLTASHFSTLNTKIANQNVLKRILITMHNENKADCNENFRICAEESMGPLYKQ